MSASQGEGMAKEINLTARELADLIWLMVQIHPSSNRSEGSPLPPRVESENESLSSQTPYLPNVPQNEESVEPSASIYPESLPSRASKPASIPGVLLEIADPLALRNALALGRSLRPLMRKVPSSTEMVFDEEATVTKIAEVEAAQEDFWLPVFQPVPSHWLEVALVVEETQRSPLWRQMLTEFQSLLERQGAFRTVSLWHLKIGSPGEVQLHAKNRQASLKELNDPSGRRLIWVVSDCVSSMWHDGSVLKVLRDWGRMQPVSLLQLLPERLWQRTALGWGTEVQLSSDNPGVPNARLFADLASRGILLDSPRAFALPIVTLDAVPLKNWAKVLAGVGGSRTPGLVFLPEEIVPQGGPSDDLHLSPKARVSRFRAAASPLSRQLARMMAAAPVSLPVIRLIQQTLLPNSHAVHVAEVLMGGLLEPEAGGGMGEANYEFYPGVREELIKITPKSKTVDVILRLSEFVERELRLKQSVRTFEAMLFEPDVDIDSDYLPFARITAETLQLLGGKYAEMAESILRKLGGASVRTADELVAYKAFEEKLEEVREEISQNFYDIVSQDFDDLEFQFDLDELSEGEQQDLDESSIVIDEDREIRVDVIERNLKNLIQDNEEHQAIFELSVIIHFSVRASYIDWEKAYPGSSEDPLTYLNVVYPNQVVEARGEVSLWLFPEVEIEEIELNLEKPIELNFEEPIQRSTRETMMLESENWMRHKVSEIKSQLNDINYDNFARKHHSTSRPVELIGSFSTLLNELDELVSQASNKFPRAKVDSLFREGQESLDVRRRAVNKNNFEYGKATLLEVVSIIENNLIQEERRKQPTTPLNPVNTKSIPTQPPMIFVSHYDEQILQEIKTVFGVLATLSPEMDNLQSTERKQSNSLETVSSRIDEIRSCSSAIVCWPPPNSDDNSINALAYLDLGACLALFPERTLLIHQGNTLPDGLVSQVETFQYLGTLDFTKGLELARQILNILRKDS